ncbi:MAG: erythromycin esterase family protein [Sphingobacterium sp.]
MNLSFDNYYSNNVEQIYKGNTSYDYLLDNKTKYNGNYSLNIRSNSASKNPAFFLKTIDSDSLLNKRLSIKSMIKHNGANSNGEIRLLLSFVDKNSNLIKFIESDNLIANHTVENWEQYEVEGSVPKETAEILFGGYSHNVSNTWFDQFEIYSDEIRYNDVVLRTKKLDRKERKVLEEFVYPIDPAVLTPTGDDLQLFNEILTDGKIIGLGENTHGSSELLKLRQRIVHHILEVDPKFNIIALEAGYAEVNKLIDVLSANPHEEFDFFSIMDFWVYNTEEFKEFILSVRNSNPENVTFKGVDNQFYTGAIKVLREQFKDDDLLHSKINELSLHLEKIDDRFYKTRHKTILKNESDSLNRILNLIQTQTTKLDSSLKRDSIVQCLNIIQDYLINSPKTRDSLMAVNIHDIYNKSLGKIIFTAHNEHLKRTGHSAGRVLADSLRDKYISVGFTFFDGAYTASGKNGITQYPAETAYPTTIEYYLNQLNDPILLLDLKKIRSDTREELNLIKEYIGFRAVGASKKKNEFEYRRIIDDFDYLIYIDRSHPTQFLK